MEHFNFRSDPHSVSVQIVAVNWEKLHFYAFPPLISYFTRAAKDMERWTEWMLIELTWPSQVCCIELKEINIKSFMLYPRPNLLSFTPKNILHPFDRYLLLTSLILVLYHCDVVFSGALERTHYWNCMPRYPRLWLILLVFFYFV